MIELWLIIHSQNRNKLTLELRSIFCKILLAKQFCKILHAISNMKYHEICIHVIVTIRVDNAENQSPRES